MKTITFPNGAITMSGNLFTPEGFDPAVKYPAIVTVHPGGGVKEQTSGLYAEKFAAQGYVTLAFDASFQGDSGGEPRHLEDPAARVEDVRAAVDYLQSFAFVDAERIGAFGICAGGGYTVNAALTDYRIKALGTVSAVNIGTAFRRDWLGLNPDSAAVPTLQGVAQQRTAEAQGAEIMHIPYVPVEPDENTPRDLAEASEYYLTPRACHPNAGNTFQFTRSISRIFTFDAFHLLEELLQQPVIVIAGSEAESLWMSTELFGRARTAGKEFHLVDGAGHMDLYDVPQYVDQAVAKATAFFDTHLAAQA